jgi:hypothetical protein
MSNLRIYNYIVSDATQHKMGFFAVDKADCPLRRAMTNCSGQVNLATEL